MSCDCFFNNCGTIILTILTSRTNHTTHIVYMPVANRLNEAIRNYTKKYSQQSPCDITLCFPRHTLSVLHSRICWVATGETKRCNHAGLWSLRLYTIIVSSSMFIICWFVHKSWNSIQTFCHSAVCFSSEFHFKNFSLKWLIPFNRPNTSYLIQ